MTVCSPTCYGVVPDAWREEIAGDHRYVTNSPSNIKALCLLVIQHCQSACIVARTYVCKLVGSGWCSVFYYWYVYFMLPSHNVSYKIQSDMQ